MERSAAAHPRPEDVLAYADGEGDAGTVAHVATCMECAAEVSAYTLLDRTLRARLLRVDCLDPQALGELALGLLPPERALSVRQHLALCPACERELAEFRVTLQGDALADLLPRPGPLARLVARLLPAPGLRLAPAGVRGADDETARRYEADGLTLSLTVEAEGGGPARRWRLLGLVIDEAGDGLVTGLVVRVLRHGDVVRETELDDLGNVTVGGLEAGMYDLELVRETGVIAIEGLEIGPAHAQTEA